ncbi:acetyltransferase, GNAT family [Treponema primitia ZAS-2]|uniref:Acetyltransferase, GNAT family n=1 Tax=Treponema primitia (strain ATCC BAA-887 / DSM 12427 / ZAS-2) TaxID=545694 RepID=F5YPS6_TREPZ|nr:GNAT family N-acetyltransferase [Treponema primitia]AEF85410.1 acetyltransferase, GNAT family [Treponema primitia ZAS-2]
MIEYRKAKLDDIEALTELRINMLLDQEKCSGSFVGKFGNVNNAYLQKSITDGSYIIFVAYENSSIIAMCGIALFTLPPNTWCITGKTAYLSSLYTKKEYRNNGIASKLLTMVMEEIKNSNIERVLLHTTEQGEALYKKIGFEYSEDTMAFYPLGKDFEKI